MSCLLWQLEQHTISKKYKGKMRTPRAAERDLIVLAPALTVFLVRETGNQDRWIQSCFLCLSDLGQMIFTSLCLFIHLLNEESEMISRVFFFTTLHFRLHSQ